MQKKLIALAIAGLVSGGAVAQSSNVTIYGRANLAFDNYSATGSFGGAATDFQGRNRVADSSSRIGFKGIEDLGNGLNLNWQCESQVNMNQGGTNTMANVVGNSSVGLCGRQSYVGLSGNWGEFRLGRQEVYWTNGRVNDIGANELVTASPISTTGGGLLSAPYNRTSNVLSYFTPSVSGFQGAVFYVAGAEAAVAGASANGKGYSLQLNYNNGPIAVKYDWAKSYAQDTLTTGLDPATGVPTVAGSKLALAYFYQGDSKVGLVLAQLTANSVAGNAVNTIAGNNLKQSTWDFNWEHYWGSGNIQSIVNYGKIGNASLAAGNGSISGVALNFNASQTGATAWTVGGKYFFSKRTAMYLETEKITNGTQQWADYAAGGYSAGIGGPAGGIGAASRGADPKITAIGVIHDF